MLCHAANSLLVALLVTCWCYSGAAASDVQVDASGSVVTPPPPQQLPDTLGDTHYFAVTDTIRPLRFKPLPCTLDPALDSRYYCGPDNICGRAIVDGAIPNAVISQLQSLITKGTALRSPGAGGAHGLHVASGTFRFPGGATGNVFQPAAAQPPEARGRSSVKGDRKAVGPPPTGGGELRDVEDIGVPVEFSRAELRAYDEARVAMLKLVKATFNAASLRETAFPFVSQIGGNEAWIPPRDRDMYYQQHCDKNLTECYDYSALLYLSDYGSDFEGGKFAFEDEDGTTTVVEPRIGRIVMFSSGWENYHQVRLVTQGVRNALLVWFTGLSQASPEYNMKCASRRATARRREV